MGRRVVRASTEAEWRRPWLTAAPTSLDHRVPLRAAPPAEPVPEPVEPPAPKKPKEPVQQAIPLTLTKNDPAREFYPDMPLRGEGDSWSDFPAPPRRPEPVAPKHEDVEQLGLFTHPYATGVQSPIPLGGQDFQWSDSIPEEEVYRALVEKYNAASDDQKRWGSQWYDTAGEYIRNLSQATGRSESQVAAVMAAFSPQTAWDPNMQQATYFLLNHDPADKGSMERMRAKMPSIGANLDRAARIMAADGNDDAAIEAALAGGNDTPKIRNFWRGLRGDRDAMTIDTWMVRAMLGQHLDLGESAAAQDVLNWSGSYDKLSAVARRAAKDLGVDPRALQAIVWSQVNPSADYSPLSPEAWKAQDEARTKRWTKSPMKKPMPDYTHGPGWRALPGPQLSGSPGYGPGRAAAAAQPIFRGLKLRLSPAERARITGLFESDPQAASDALLDLVLGGGGDEPTGGAGRHWSEDEQVARGFAAPASGAYGPGEDVEDARSLGVVLRGLRPAAGEDPARTNSGYEHTPLANERLVSLLPGTDVELTGVGLGNVAPHEDADGWSYADGRWHDLPATRRLRAERLYRGIPLGGEGDVDLDALAGGVGVHWSPRRDVAENFANWGSSEEDLAAFAAAGHPFRPVVVEAEWDGAGRDPGGVSGGMPLFDDDEVVLRAGTPLDVRSVRGRGGELLVEPRRMRAAQDRARAVETRLPTPEVMGYFHSVITPEDVPAALAADVRANGVREPIEIVTDGVRAAIADGHHRALSAEGGGLPSVPVRVFRVGPDAMLGGRGGVLGGELATALGHRVSFRLGWYEKDESLPGNWAFARDDATGETLAELCWDGDTGEVNWIETYKGHRRRGIARDLFHWVRNNHQSDLHHSDDLSEDGRAFAEAVAALRVARRLLRGF